MKTSILGFSALFLAACSSAFGTSDPSDPGAAAPPPAPPPLTGKPADAELTEQYGVFVTTNGTADGDGSRAHPLGTIAAAIALAKQKALRVYVCVGTYSEPLTLASGVSVIGGLICDDPSLWSAPPGQRSRVEAPQSPAVRAIDIGVPTRFEGFDVVAPKGAPSSIALLASNASVLVIANASVTASDAADGRSGDAPVGNVFAISMNGAGGAPYVFEAPPLNQLVSKAPQHGGVAGTGACGTPGGAGASGGSWYCEKYLVGGIPFYQWTPNTTIAGAQYLPGTPGNPGPGSGNAGANGVDGSSAGAIGALTADGYTTADGATGTDGKPGNGGVGGPAESTPQVTCNQDIPAYLYFGASGPGGGAGGCAGLAGKPGTGGGASIGALVLASGGLTFDAVDIKAGNGGNGGAGSLGSDATVGGSAGAAPSGTGIAQAGGNGGRAGVSGSGAGGPSFGIAHTGGAPTIVASTKVAFGAPGKGVPASDRTDATGTRTLPASADGIAADVHGF